MQTVGTRLVFLTRTNSFSKKKVIVSRNSLDSHFSGHLNVEAGILAYGAHSDDRRMKIA